MTNPDVKRCGVLSVYSGGRLRKRWKACYCRLYTNSLFHCFDGMVCTPKISIILNAVQRYILTGRSTRRLDGRPKVRDSEERLLLAIPSRLDFPLDRMQWIKFLDDASMRNWMTSIEETLDPGDSKRYDFDNERSFSPEMRWSRSLPAHTSSEASDVSSGDMPHYRGRQLHGMSTGPRLLAGAAALSGMAACDRDRGRMHGRGGNTLVDSSAPAAQSAVRAHDHRSQTPEGGGLALRNAAPMGISAKKLLRIGGPDDASTVPSDERDEDASLVGVSTDYSEAHKNSLSSRGGNDVEVQTEEDVSSSQVSRRTVSVSTRSSGNGEQDNLFKDVGTMSDHSRGSDAQIQAGKALSGEASVSTGSRSPRLSRDWDETSQRASENDMEMMQDNQPGPGDNCYAMSSHGVEVDEGEQGIGTDDRIEDEPVQTSPHEGQIEEAIHEFEELMLAEEMPDPPVEQDAFV